MWASLDDEGATEESVKSLVGGNNQFAFDLYSKISENSEKNIFFSPWSIYVALGMTYEGARGKTADEMKSTIHLPENDAVRKPSFARIQNLLNENKEYTLETGNALWAQENFPFLDDYFDTIQNYYGGKVTDLDFVGDLDEACNTINDWVSEKTRGKIENLIKRSMITPLTRLVLTNAIYFKGDWLKQFNEDETQEDDFWIEPENSVKVPMMTLSGENAKFNYAETDDLKALELPYKGEQLSMLILLPKERFGLGDLEKTIEPEELEEIKEQLHEEKVSIRMPKFKFETKYKLSETLKEMGMPTAFNPGVANFSGMNGRRDLFIDFVVHKAYIEVNEKGTEAAAATGVGMKLTAVPSEKTFHADHPFLFLIQEEGTGNILFMGGVSNPSGQ